MCKDIRFKRPLVYNCTLTGKPTSPSSHLSPPPLQCQQHKQPWETQFDQCQIELPRFSLQSQRSLTSHILRWECPSAQRSHFLSMPGLLLKIMDWLYLNPGSLPQELRSLPTKPSTGPQDTSHNKQGSSSLS